MNYGHFSADGKEYIITDPATPTPWINYIHNGRYFAIVSNNGGGVSYFKSPLHGRITRYRINDVPPDRPGKTIYARDLDSGEIWSLTWQPVGPPRLPQTGASPSERERLVKVLSSLGKL